MFHLSDEIMISLFGQEYYSKLQQKSNDLTNGIYYDVMLALALGDVYKDQQKLLKAQVNTGAIGG